ncbi:Uncharacterized beta-barrel protein YwiB, DUF1934 family [Caminicella sporogenes DSM 14501]|uniref:Uncharacterized beta-barrel protein YwiB, DUF1934 family n=1 Tax=Caminicella sporogenes DSM 14501 TaxID=1121266 RepID=A0A1M6PP80_9FIRM|nr:DUF1934 domain-containing protein [Caminicella sporogenes]RKD22029.1 calycin [Caminicella sporogenes]SHK09814.1 Uncharacterized beta-barrel protein YwiB, DUF1934 family [Caminicella sporogenes DSM 14501]
MKNIILKIEGKQRPSGGEEDMIEFITEGRYYNKNNAKYIVYEESEISGMEGCITTLKIIDDKIIMKRFGKASSELIFEKGKRYVSNYNTPYGSFKMEILTKELKYSINEDNKGNISIKYNVSLQGLSEGSNEINIQIM